jgi:hypothetical protein
VEGSRAMLAYYAAALPERLGLMKIGETLRNEYPLDPTYAGISRCTAGAS